MRSASRVRGRLGSVGISGGSAGRVCERAASLSLERLDAAQAFLPPPAAEGDLQIGRCTKLRACQRAGKAWVRCGAFSAAVVVRR